MIGSAAMKTTPPTPGGFDMAAAAESMRDRILDQIAQRIVEGGLDVRAATLQAADHARREALRKGWAPNLASALALHVLKVGAEWAAEVAAELIESESGK